MPSLYAYRRWAWAPSASRRCSWGVCWSSCVRALRTLRRPSAALRTALQELQSQVRDQRTRTCRNKVKGVNERTNFVRCIHGGLAGSRPGGAARHNRSLGPLTTSPSPTAPHDSPTRTTANHGCVAAGRFLLSAPHSAPSPRQRVNVWVRDLCVTVRDRPARARLTRRSGLGEYRVRVGAAQG